jgi:hypothetical protein
MLVSVHHAVEIDICPGCLGIWLDSEEYGLLLENTRSANLRSRSQQDLNRPKLMPDWMKTPANLRGCQLCGLPRLAPELSYQAGLFKCDGCFESAQVANATRMRRLQSRNQRRYDSRDRPALSVFAQKLLELLTAPIGGG